MLIRECMGVVYVNKPDLTGFEFADSDFCDNAFTPVWLSTSIIYRGYRRQIAGKT